MQAEADGALWHASPNYGSRRSGADIALIVIHFTAMASAEAALDRLCDRAAAVSAHYLIGADGQLWQLVRETHRAWHAGEGTWGGAADVNSRSIGIELDNRGDQPFPPVQMARLNRLLKEMLARHALPAKAVIGHSDMAPERKSDPGRLFDWRGLAEAGLAVWPAQGTLDLDPDPERFLTDAAVFGYPRCGLSQVLDAFRQRFRADARGALDARDMGMMADLARRFPIDPAQRNT